MVGILYAISGRSPVRHKMETNFFKNQKPKLKHQIPA